MTRCPCGYGAYGNALKSTYASLDFSGCNTIAEKV